MQISEPAEYVILGLLKTRPMHGYEMFQHFEHGTLGQIIHLEMSQMYAFLKKLEKLAYIEAEQESRGRRPPRRTFHLTGEGEQVFCSWLTLPVEKPRDIRILFLIKLYFIRYFLPDQIDYLIEQQIHACRCFLAYLESQQHENTSTHTGDDIFFNRVVLRSRIHQTHALLGWMLEL
jgi:DNA-binding PadR family transcriptional regulator